MSSPVVEEPHVLLFPFPGQSHMTPVLMLGELLSLAGLHVTFLNTEHMQQRLLRLSPTHAQLAEHPRFRFCTIHDGLPEDDPRQFLNFLIIEESIRTHSREKYKELLVGCKGRDPDGWPPVSCVIADGIMPMALDVAEEVGIPTVLIRTSSPCAFWAYHHIPQLIKEGEVPFPENADLDEMARGVPGMERILRRRDLPGFCRKAKTLTDRGLQFLATSTTNTSRARGLILNTFEALDGVALSHIRSLYPNTYAVGPLHTHLRSYRSRLAKAREDDGPTPPPSSNSISGWKADGSCMTWLDSQSKKSVVYVSFGSAIVVTQEELLEFWYGLVNSGQRFLWVIRPDMVKGEADATIPAELETGTRERGCLVAWAPQEDVLAHPAVGCFLTHSGWSSTLESVVAGVPMICWAFFADQQVNSRFISEVWRIGLDMKDTCHRTVVERMVREVMRGDRAEELRTSAAELAKLAQSSIEEGGASYVNLHRLIQDIRFIYNVGSTGASQEILKQSLISLEFNSA